MKTLSRGRPRGGTFDPFSVSDLDRALRASDHTVATLALRLEGAGFPVSPRTIEGWRYGRRRPSQAARRALELALALPRGALQKKTKKVECRPRKRRR